MRVVKTRSRLGAMLAALVVFSLLAIPAGGVVSDATTDGIVDSGYLVVELSSAPLAHDDTTKVSGRFDPSSRAYQQAMQRLEREHQKFIDRLAKEAPGVEVTNEFFLTANAVTLRLNGATLADVSRVPGIKRINEPTLYRLDMDSSVGLIGVPGFWTGGPGREHAGAGIKVGVIDSGIDPGHPFFDCGLEDGEKVNFGGVYYSGVGILPQVPALPAIFGPGFIPGPGDPLYSSSPHGTHVAGTIGGCVTTISDGVFGGTQLSGVAPGAQLWDYNVFPFFGAGMVAYGGSAFSHDIAAAIEDAVADGMDVINMSLGGGVQGPHDFLAEVANNAVEADVVVVTSAGNSGPGTYTVGSPGSAENVIAVGATTNSRGMGVVISVTDGGPTYLAVPGAFPDFDGSTYSIVDWGGADNEACSATGTSENEHASEVVVIARGSCTFSQKVANAKTSGAIGVIVYNNVSGDAIGMARTAGFDDTIPAVMVTLTDGQTLEDAATLSATISAPTTVPAVPNLMADFSSRGPAPFTSIVKPDVVAPGVNILSSVWSDGWFPGVFGDTSWELYNGTSMASPHVAGAAAALLGADGSLTPAEVKSRFVNTATVLAFGVWDQGGGLISLTAARDASVTFEPASASFGYFQGRKPVSGTVTLTMYGGACAVDGVTGSGSTYVEASVFGTSLSVKFDGGRDVGTGLHGGYVDLTCEGESYHIPWGAVVNR